MRWWNVIHLLDGYTIRHKYQIIMASQIPKAKINQKLIASESVRVPWKTFWLINICYIITYLLTLGFLSCTSASSSSSSSSIFFGTSALLCWPPPLVWGCITSSGRPKKINHSEILSPKVIPIEVIKSGIISDCP